MLKNYLTIAVRSIIKQKFYSLINILGLSIGLAASFFVVLYVTDELSYDNFHHDLDHLYRVSLHARIAGQEVHVTNTCPPLATAMVEEIPEVSDALRTRRRFNMVIRNEDIAFTEDKVFDADSNFFSFFDFELLEGNPKTALENPNSIVLSKSMATKYFGDESPLGKMLTIGNQNTAFNVTGIVQEVPSNSHFHFDILLSASSFPYSSNNIWLNNFLYTYFRTDKGADLENVQFKLDELVAKYVGPEVQQFMGISMEQLKEQGGMYGFLPGPVKDIHLHSKFGDEPEPQGDITYVYIFGAIGIFILVIACINFMNLTTARSAGRAKEVGMRKALGSNRSTLIGQFLVESMLFALISLFVALLTVYLLLPGFNLISGKELHFNALSTPFMLGFMALITIFTGLLAGSYPAFYLTSFQVAAILKGKLNGTFKVGGIRSALVVFQFIISTMLIICTIVVYKQLVFTQNKNLGFNKDHVMIISNTSRLGTNMDAFKNTLLSETVITTASYSNSVIPGVNNTTVFRPAGTENDHMIGTYSGDYDHLEAFGFELVSGRNFNRDIPSDSSACLINQAAAKEFGWEDPLGKELFYPGNQRQYVVAGVIKDFNFESLKNKVRPMVIMLTNRGNILTVKLNTDNLSAAVDLVESKWKEMATGEPFDYSFLDDDFDRLYRSEQRLVKLFTIFAVFAISIACLGLFGLAAFVAEQRRKEIGIRKVLGASFMSITTLLSKEFTKFVFIAFIISVLPAYFLMDNWLQGFAFRINISIWIFLASGFIVMVIAIATVSFQSIKAAQANPVDSLKYE